VILVIDNYDSFTFNLVQYLGELGAAPEVVRNDVLTADEVMARRPAGIVLSPGPKTPLEAGVCNEVIAAAAGRIPLLGVCLGHQCIGHVYGGEVVRAERLMHGKTSAIRHDGEGMFRGLPNPFTATRYHSLLVKRDTFPDQVLAITAETAEGEIMGLRHREHAVFGVQFHPESILTEGGRALLQNFLDLTRS
jgi:anthranilate synthase/aminodeoxychorismate synthase-like glutamine amidotransferase